MGHVASFTSAAVTVPVSELIAHQTGDFIREKDGDIISGVAQAEPLMNAADALVVRKKRARGLREFR